MAAVRALTKVVEATKAHQQFHRDQGSSSSTNATTTAVAAQPERRRVWSRVEQPRERKRREGIGAVWLILS